jgi:electron transfer flavoprotein beta subunit
VPPPLPPLLRRHPTDLDQLKPRITPPTLTLAGLKQSLNPFDELAIEEALRLRERHQQKTSPLPVSDILAVSAGPAKAADALRTALALGVDRALHILTDEDPDGSGRGELEPLAVARLLAAVARGEDANLVLLGKQSIADDAAQVGPMLAGLLGWGQATQAAAVRILDDGERAEVEREVDGGTETLRLRLPCVVTADLRLNVPRYASLPNIRKARTKPLAKKGAAEFGVDVAPRLRTVRVDEPAVRKAGVKVADVDAMIAKLKEMGAL